MRTAEIQNNRLMDPAKKNRVIVLISAGILALLIALLIQFVSHGQTRYTYDSKKYVSFANNLLMGHGLVSNLHGIAGVRKRIELLRAPLYPLSIAATSTLTGISTFNTASIIVTVSFPFGMFLLTVWLSRYFALWIAITAAGLGAVSFPTLMMAATALTESVFFCLLVTCFLILDIYFKKNVSIWLVVAIGLLSGLLFLFRYIGISIMPIVAILIIFNTRHSTAQRIKHIIIYLLIVGIIVGAMVTVNLTITGSVTGGTRSPSTVDFLSNCARALKTIGEAFWQLDIVFGNSIAIYILQIVLFSLLFMFLFFVYRRFRAGLLVLWVAAVSFVGSLVILRSIVTFDNIDGRLLGPALPILSALVLAFIINEATLLGFKKKKYIKALSYAAIVIVLIVSRLATVNYTRKHSTWRNIYWTSPHQSQTLNFVRNSVSSKEVIVGNREALAIIVFPDSPEFVVLPHRASSAITENSLRELVANEGVRYLVFGLPDINARLKRYGPYVDRILTRKSTKGITLIKEFEDGRVYDVSNLR